MSIDSSINVDILWSLVHHGHPQEEDLGTLKSKIEEALRKANPNFVVNNKILAVGAYDLGGLQDFTVSDDFKLQMLPMPHLIRLPLVDRRMRNGFQRKLKRAKVNEFLRTEIREKFLISDYVLVIGGDIENLDPEEMWREKGRNLLLAGEDDVTNPYGMHFSGRIARAVWSWEAMKRGGDRFMNKKICY